MVHHKRILITGAAGFIGAHLVKKLLSSKNTLHIFIRKTTNLWRIKDIESYLKLYTVSLENHEEIKKIVNKIKPEIIYHLAAYGNYSYESDPINIIKSNLIGTANLIWSLNSINYECFINTGSSSEYGFKSKPMKESDLLEPNSFYAALKASSTYFCQAVARSFNRPIITLRPFSVYGPYEEPKRFVPTVITNILSNKPIQLTAKKAHRDFIYIDDVINCYIKATKQIKQKIYGEAFNVGTGIQYSNEDIVRFITTINGKKVIIVKGGYKNRSWDSDFWVSDISKSRNLLNWQPKYTLQMGLKKTYNWFKKNNEYRKIYS